MITIKYLGQIAEIMGRYEEKLEWEYGTIADLLLRLNEKQNWQEVIKNNPLLKYAINHEIVPLEAYIKNNDEIAFLPPVTGG